jgi:hypothetical protein
MGTFVGTIATLSSLALFSLLCQSPICVVSLYHLLQPSPSHPHCILLFAIRTHFPAHTSLTPLLPTLRSLAHSALLPISPLLPTCHTVPYTPCIRSHSAAFISFFHGYARGELKSGVLRPVALLVMEIQQLKVYGIIPQQPHIESSPYLVGW